MELDDTTAHDDLGKRTEEVVRDLLRVLIPSETLEAHPHLADTPRRVASWLLQYSQNGKSLEEVLGPIFAGESYDGIVLVKDIEFTALCAHHLLPFHGRAAIGYVPNAKLLGLSKLARVTHFFAERVTLQEHITGGIVEALGKTLEPLFVGVYLYDVEHGCISARGVREAHAKTNTYSAWTGPGVTPDGLHAFSNLFWQTFRGGN